MRTVTNISCPTCAHTAEIIMSPAITGALNLRRFYCVIFHYNRVAACTYPDYKNIHCLYILH